MNLIRKWTAPLSAIFLVVIAALAFTQVRQAGTEYPPPILDPQFELWGWDASSGVNKPLVWELEYHNATGNQVLLQKTEMAGESALEIRIFQSGQDGWVYVYLRQLIDGARLSALLNETVGASVFLENTCSCKQASPSNSTLFGIETNDGEHTLRFLFSEAITEPQQTPSSRTVFLSTAPNKWENHTINVAGEYRNAKWRSPERLEFGVTFQAPPSATGWHAGYVHGFSTSRATQLGSSEQNSKTPAQAAGYIDMLCLSEGHLAGGACDRRSQLFNDRLD